MITPNCSLSKEKLSIDHIFIVIMTIDIPIQRITSFEITKTAVSALSVPFLAPKKV